MKVDSTAPVHSHHYAQPRAIENGKGKAAESPAFQARAGLAESGDVPFGKLVSEIAKSRKDAPPEAPVVPEAPDAPESGLPIDV
jgi:hypothetical protein